MPSSSMPSSPAPGSLAPGVPPRGSRLTHWLAPLRGQSPGLAADLLAAVVAVGVLTAISAHVRTTSGTPLDGLGYALLVIAGMATGLCRRWPKTAVGVVTAVLGIFLARRYPDGPVWVTGWITLAVLSWRTSRRTALAGALAMLLVLSAVAVFAGSGGFLLPAIFSGWATAAVFGGYALRSRHERLAGLRERALFLERTREEETRRRVAEERLRIARDLHDSVAHAMATINVQAGAAVHVLSKRPEAAGEALAVIQRASGDVLDELGAMLTVLRDGTGLGGTGLRDGTGLGDSRGPRDRTGFRGTTARAERAPVPGAGEIARLAESTAESGLAVALDVTGPVGEVPDVIGTAAYRVVQESLTNVLRHSRATAVRVRLAIEADGGVLLDVADDGPGRSRADGGLTRPGAAGGTGVGILGMRERVVSTGGEFQAGPAEDGGFRVRATWGPVRERATRDHGREGAAGGRGRERATGAAGRERAAGGERQP